MLFDSKSLEKTQLLVGDIVPSLGFGFQATLNFDVPPEGRAFIKLIISSIESSEMELTIDQFTPAVEQLFATYSHDDVLSAETDSDLLHLWSSEMLKLGRKG